MGVLQIKILTICETRGKISEPDPVRYIIFENTERDSSPEQTEKSKRKTEN
jgi:hypothetical protein